MTLTEPVAVSEPIGPRGFTDRLRSVPANRWVGLGVGIGFLIVVLSQNAWIFTQPVVEFGDDATNSILIDKARELQLLVGNYSRVGFNHPGPFFHYLQGGFETVFYGLHIVPRQYNAHALAIASLNAAIVGICASIIGRRVRPALLALALVPLVALSPVVLPGSGSLVSTWPPSTYMIPFLLLLISTGSLMSTDFRDLPFFVFAGGILIHGHVSFFVIVGLFTAVVLVVAFVKYRRRTLELTRRTIITTAVVLGVFALPIVLNLILNWPGEFGKYLTYSESSKAGKATARQAFQFVGEYWPGTGALRLIFVAGIVTAAVALVAYMKKGADRQFLVGLIGASAIGTLAVFIYALRGVDDLTWLYVAYYYFEVPFVMGLVVLLGIGLKLCSTEAKAAVFGGFAVVAALVLSFTVATNALQVNPGDEFVSATQYVNDRVPSTSTKVLDLQQLGAWPGAAALVEEFSRDGMPVCVATNTLEFVFTAKFTCTPDQITTGTKVNVYASDVPAPPGAFKAHDLSVYVPSSR